MKGLIIKDIYCLKKQITTYGFVIFGVVAVAIMFILSERYGNLRISVSGMEEAGFDIAAVVKIAVMFFMVLPLISTGDISNLFVYDKTASFYKVGASFPVSVKKRVLSKFLTVLMFFAAGLVIDILMSAVMSVVSDIILFSKCIGTLASITACMVVFTSLIIMLNYAGIAPAYSTALPIVVFAVLFLLVKIKDIKSAIINDDFASFSAFFHNLINAFENKPYYFLIAAAAVAAVCYFLSVFFADKKRGVA
ncbi:MAG: ABC-2 transporter permease [Clostridia bacterium]|nr:ABC-2 transporter permease [Clostridia bacterium]